MSHRQIRKVRRQLATLESWLNSANGAHSPENDLKVALEIVTLRDRLSGVTVR